MTGNDPLSDALSGLNNAENAGHLQYTAKPASKLIGNVFEVFHDHGYIGQFEHVQDGKAGYFDVELKGAINKCAPIKPRYSIALSNFEKWEKRYLPAQNYGALVLTTSQGVMSHYEARKAGIGGQLIAYIY